MRKKNRKLILLKRLFIWTIYLFSGFILYFKNGYLYPFLIQFAKVVYPLSIFWLQIRIKRKSNSLSIDSSLSTSQLWFSILPVIATILTIIFSISNALIYIFVKLS